MTDINTEDKNINQDAAMHIRQARVLGSEYGLDAEQISKLEVAKSQEQKLLAREFNAENLNKPQAKKPGEYGRELGEKANKWRKNSGHYFQ